MLLNGGGGSRPESRARSEAVNTEVPRQDAPKGFRERERERAAKARRDPDAAEDTGLRGIDVQEHADRLISQASEISQSVWSKASSFWKEGKEKVAKAYEERTAATATPSDGRPKWMQEGAGRFRYDDEEQERIPQRPRPKAKPPVERFVEDESAPAPPQPEQTIDLFSDSRSQPPVVTTQRPIQRPQPASRRPTQQSIQSTVAPTPPLPATRERPLPTASPTALATAIRHKTAGTDQFKLGQYGPAIESYTSAINALPSGHLLLVPLFTNRSLARIRNGEYKAAADDAGGALRIIVVEPTNNDGGAVQEFDPSGGANQGPRISATSWSLSIEPKNVLSASQQKLHNGGWEHPQGLGVDLVDGFVKALRRRAEGLEGREKWNDALKDWEVLTAAGWIQESVKTEAQRGAARCRKMTDGGDAPKSGSQGVAAKPSTQAPKPNAFPPRPKPKPKPTPASTEPSAALKSLQATTAQAEADDNLKHQLKDSVDAKLLSWKGGKESNIRALLASLDLVLWDEILKGGVKSGGLHELVTPAQVKKNYVKVIARVHPDKVSTVVLLFFSLQH